MKSASSTEEVADKAKVINMTCRKAMWSGYGTPAGHCDAPAYGPERLMRDNPEWWTAPEIARCPNHGGPPIEEFHRWLLEQIKS